MDLFSRLVLGHNKVKGRFGDELFFKQRRLL